MRSNASAPRRPTPLFYLALSLAGPLAAACARSTAEEAAPPPPSAPPEAAPAAGPPAAPAPGPGDSLPEPKPPEQECVWRPHVRCQQASSTPPPAAAPPPYDGCATEIPALPENSSREVRVARLSPNSSRAARKADPRACCYIEFVLQSCR
jgi:hypothetical protein